jgi:hypothetical protein
MLTKKDNEDLTQTGPGTLMGDLLRAYWIPALLSSEIPENDGTPVRIRLLGGTWLHSGTRTVRSACWMNTARIEAFLLP